jgi:predicted nucleic acid-binding protein
VTLIDANVMSELMRSSRDPRVEIWFLLNEDRIVITSIAVAERAYGVSKLEDGSRKTKLGEQITSWRLRFATRSFGFGFDTAIHYGRIMAAARASGRPMSVPDGQIAAVALEHGFQLATRNTRDFAMTNVQLIDPWET